MEKKKHLYHIATIEYSCFTALSEKRAIIREINAASALFSHKKTLTNSKTTTTFLSILVVVGKFFFLSSLHFWISSAVSSRGTIGLYKSLSLNRLFFAPFRFFIPFWFFPVFLLCVIDLWNSTIEKLYLIWVL